MAHELTLYSETMQPVGSTSATHFITVGRSRENTVQLLDPKVSRFHCRIEKTVDGITFYDLNSKNGSYINGQLCHHAILQSGDHLQLGDSIFQLSPPAATQTQAHHDRPPGLQSRREPLLPSQTPEQPYGQQKQHSLFVQKTLGTIRSSIAPFINKSHSIPGRNKPIYIASGGLLLTTAALVIFQIAKPDNLVARSQPMVMGASVEETTEHHTPQLAVNTGIITENDRQQSLALAREANIILSSGEFAKATDLFKQALQVDPNNILARDGLEEAQGKVDNLARVYFEKGEAALRTLNYHAAIKEFESVTLLLKDRRDHELLLKANKKLRHAKQKIAN